MCFLVVPLHNRRLRTWDEAKWLVWCWSSRALEVWKANHRKNILTCKSSFSSTAASRPDEVTPSHPFFFSPGLVIMYRQSLTTVCYFIRTSGWTWGGTRASKIPVAGDVLLGERFAEAFQGASSMWTWRDGAFDQIPKDGTRKKRPRQEGRGWDNDRARIPPGQGNHPSHFSHLCTTVAFFQRQNKCLYSGGRASLATQSPRFLLRHLP